MARQMKADWIVDILSDIENFARFNSYNSFASDLGDLLSKHEEELKGMKQANENVVPFPEVDAVKETPQK
jgi:hypothetical protein